MKKQDGQPFTSISNDLLCDPNLSAKAKGLYCYLYSKPDDWDFSGDRIAEDFTDWRKAILTWLSELQLAWWIVREKQPDGKMMYIINRAKVPKGDLGTVPKRQSAKMGTINKKEKEIRKSNKKERVISNDITAEADSDFWLPLGFWSDASPTPPTPSPRRGDIDELILALKATADELCLAYDQNKERLFAKHLLDTIEYGKLCDKAWRDRIDFACNIMRASVVIHYWKWPALWPQSIYKEYASIYNDTILKKSKQKKTNTLVV